MSRHIPLVLLAGLAALLLASCGGTEAQVTAVVSNNTVAATATAVTQSVAATTTAAIGAAPSVALPSIPALPSGVPPLLPTARPSGAAPPSGGSPPPVVATARASGIPVPSGRPPVGPPSAPPSVQSGGSGPGGTVLPAGFPLPSQYQVVSSLKSGNDLLVVLSVASSQEAYDFYKGALPGAGYRVTDSGGVSVPGAGFIGNLVLSSDTYTGNIAFTPGAANDQAVTIQLQPK